MEYFSIFVGSPPINKHFEQPSISGIIQTIKNIARGIVLLKFQSLIKELVCDTQRQEV